MKSRQPSAVSRQPGPTAALALVVLGTFAVVGLRPVALAGGTRTDEPAPADGSVGPNGARVTVTVEEAPAATSPSTASSSADAPALPAAKPDAADVVVSLGDGVAIDWTRLVLEVSASARGYGVGGDQAAVEQQARFQAGPRFLSGTAAIQVTSDQTFADLEQAPVVGDQLRSRKDRWTVAEARYFSSGKVELDNELSLLELLKPWTLSVARPVPDGPPPATDPSAPTGLLVDVRGLSASPAWAPRVLAPDGTPLFDGHLFDADAVDKAPVVYVTDPGAPAAGRAGGRPLVLKATEARGCDVVLAPADAEKYRSSLGTSRVPSQGTVVFVVDAR